MLILNRVPPRSVMMAQVIQSIRELHPTTQAQLGNRVAFAHSMGAGGTVMETAPSTKGAEEAIALAREIWAIATR